MKEGFNMTIETMETINLKDIENLRKWAEYMPKCFTDNLDNEKFYDRLLEDRIIIHKIKSLYKFIENITGVKPDLDNEFFRIGRLSFEQYDEFEKLIRIPTICISAYATLKLTKEEKEYCYSYLGKCNKDNSLDIDKEVNNINNFYLKDYTQYLLLHHPKSDYISSEINIQKRVIISEKKLVKKFKEIARKEAIAWEHRKYRFMPRN